MSVLNQNGEEQVECPLCMEPLEVDDLNFFPCTCGYQICRFCWHRIRTDENGLCPACRKAYSEDPADFIPLSKEQVAQMKADKRQRDQQRKAKLSESRKHLASVRVVQRNLVFVVGLPMRLADPEVLRKHEYFGKFGRIHKVVINQSTAYAGTQGPSASAYVTYMKSDDALRAIQSVNNITIDGRTIKSSLGTTKYCSHFMKNQPCPKADCMYLHDFGDQEASFTKEQMHAGKHQEYEKKLHDALITKMAAQVAANNGTTPPETTNNNNNNNHQHTTSKSEVSNKAIEAIIETKHNNCNEINKEGVDKENWPQLVVDKIEVSSSNKKTQQSGVIGGAKAGKKKVEKKIEKKGNCCEHTKTICDDLFAPIKTPLITPLITQLNTPLNTPLNTTLNPALNTQLNTSLNTQLNASLNTSLNTSLNAQLNTSLKSALMATPPALLLVDGVINKSMIGGGLDDNSSFFSANSFTKLSESASNDEQLNNAASACGHHLHEPFLPDINNTDSWEFDFGYTKHSNHLEELAKQRIHHTHNAHKDVFGNGAFAQLQQQQQQLDMFSKSAFFADNNTENLLESLAKKSVNYSYNKQQQDLLHQQYLQPPQQQQQHKEASNGMDHMSKFLTDYYKNGFNSFQGHSSNNQQQQQQQQGMMMHLRDQMQHTQQQQHMGFGHNLRDTSTTQQQQQHINMRDTLNQQQQQPMGLSQNINININGLNQSASASSSYYTNSGSDKQKQALLLLQQQRQLEEQLMSLSMGGGHNYEGLMQQQQQAPPPSGGGYYGGVFGGGPMGLAVQQSSSKAVARLDDKDLEFRFQEAQKALEELVESDNHIMHNQSAAVGVGGGATVGGRGNNPLANGFNQNGGGGGQHLPPPPPGFVQQNTHMNSFGSKILPYLNMNSQQQQMNNTQNTQNNWPSNFSQLQQNYQQLSQQQQQQQHKGMDVCNDWKILDPAILTSRRHIPNMPPLLDQYTHLGVGVGGASQQNGGGATHTAPSQQQQQRPAPSQFESQYSNFSNYSSNSSQQQQQSFNNYSHLTTQQNLNWLGNELNTQISSPPGFRTPAQATKQQEC